MAQKEATRRIQMKVLYVVHRVKKDPNSFLLWLM